MPEYHEQWLEGNPPWTSISFWNRNIAAWVPASRRETRNGGRHGWHFTFHFHYSTPGCLLYENRDGTEQSRCVAGAITRSTQQQRTVLPGAFEFTRWKQLSKHDNRRHTKGEPRVQISERSLPRSALLPFCKIFSIATVNIPHSLRQNSSNDKLSQPHLYRI
jgi:hypothetical protein